MPRIAIATLGGLIGFAVYVVAAVTLADQLQSAHWALQALYFLAAGTLWAWPAHRLILWAARARS